MEADDIDVNKSKLGSLSVHQQRLRSPGQKKLKTTEVVNKPADDAAAYVVAKLKKTHI